MELITAHLENHALDFNEKSYVFDLYIRGYRQFDGEENYTSLHMVSCTIDDVQIYIGGKDDFEEVTDKDLISELHKELTEDILKELLEKHGA